MSKLLKLSCIIGLSYALNACTYTNAVSLTNTPADRKQPVSASVKKNIFLGFNFDNDQVQTLTTSLKEKCQGGEVKGILTKDVTTLYLFGIFWARETIASGYCVKSKATAGLMNETSDEIEVSQWKDASEVKL